MEHVVYYLADPRTPRWPRYVGMTQNATQRAKQHASRHGGSNRELGAWKDALRADGLKPILVVVATFETREDARAAEWRLLLRWRRRGLADLCCMLDTHWPMFSAMCDAQHARARRVA